MEESLTENKDTHLYPVGVNVDAMETLPFNMGGGDPCGCIFETSSEVDTPASPTHGVEALADSNHDGTHAVGVDTVPSPNHGDDGILKKRTLKLGETSDGEQSPVDQPALPDQPVSPPSASVPAASAAENVERKSENGGDGVGVVAPMDAVVSDGDVSFNPDKHQDIQ